MSDVTRSVSSTPGAPRSILSIQVMRAIAAWLVVLHHFGKELSSPFANFFAQQGNFGVDIFFVISGFIIYYVTTVKDHDAPTFLLNRLFRLAPAYWLATLLILVLKYIYPIEFSYTDWSWETLLSSAAFIPSENPAGSGPFPPLVVGWTLNIEVFFYVLLATCFVFGKRYRFLACGLALMAAPVVWNREWFYGSVLGTRKLYEFVLGILIGAVYVNVHRIRAVLPPMLSSVGASLEKDIHLIGLSLLAPAGVCFLLDRDGMRLLAAGLIVAAVLCLESVLFKADNRLIRLLVRLGEMSYSTYLVHFSVIGAVIHHIGVPRDGVHEILAWLTIGCVVMLGSYLGYTFIESNRRLAMLRNSTIDFVHRQSLVLRFRASVAGERAQP
jgi:exopolysaccharide production protein ExoZ